MVRSRKTRPWLFLLPVLVILFVVGIIPLGIVFQNSFYDIFTLQSRSWVGTQWYSDLLTSSRFYDSLMRSIGFSALVLCVQFPLGISIALMIPRSGPVRTGTLVLLALPLVVPWNMIPIIWLSLIDADTGLIGKAITALGWDFDHKFNAVHTWILIAVMDTWHWVGLVTILAYSGLSSIPSAYFQAAAVDGASRLAIFRFIQLPKLRGVLMMALVLRVMDSMMIYTEAFGINAGGPNNATAFLALELGEDIAAFNYGPAAARSVLYFLIVLSVAWAMTVTSKRQNAGAVRYCAQRNSAV